MITAITNNTMTGLLGYTDFDESFYERTVDEHGRLASTCIRYDDSETSTYGNYATIFISTGQYYEEGKCLYHVSVTEKCERGVFMASGNVVIDKGRFYVNGVENGHLHDTYNDCFTIYPIDYAHLISVYDHPVF